MMKILRCGTCNAAYVPDNSGDPCPYCECNRLKAIVDKFPRTKDDVPIVPGMTLFVATSGGYLALDVIGVTGDRAFVSTVVGTEKDIAGEGCYSTPESFRNAAEPEKEEIMTGERVRVNLTDDELAIVDGVREAIKLDTGRMPTRATAVKHLITAQENFDYAKPLMNYAAMLKAFTNVDQQLEALDERLKRQEMRL